jgi:DNA-binding transcriptional LysR family regulator
VPIGPREQRFVTAGAPSYFAAHGRPAHPRDVLDHACIRHRFASGATPSWEFERGGEVIKVMPQGPLIATSGDLEIAAAIHGLGLIRTFDGFVAEAVGDGRLELVLDDWSPPFPGPYLYYASRRHMPGPLRAFVDFLKGEKRS